MATSNDSTTYVGGYSTTAASNVPPDSGATGKRYQGAAEIRQLKKVLKDTFPSVTGAVTATHTQLNQLATNTFTGDVGIGTASPQANLHVEGDAAAIQLREDSATYRMQWQSFTAFPDVYALRDPDTNRVAINFDFGDQKLEVYTADTLRMTVDSSGDVGIGTGSPACKLEVAGYTKLGDDASSPQIKTRELTGTVGAAASTTTVTTGIPVGKIVSVNVLVADSSGNLYAPGFGGTANFVFGVDSSGDIGITVSSGSTSIANQAYRAFVIFKA